MKNSLFLLLLFLLFISCKEQEARRPVSVKTHTTLASTAKELKKINTLEDQKIQNYIQLDSIRTYSTSQKGFWFTYLKKSNNNRFPKFGNSVSYALEIKDLNNQVIYSSEELGIQNYKVDKQELISGLQEGIKLMNEGDVVQFLIPAYNGYGIIGDQNKIGNNQSIIAIVTLQTIK